MLCLSLLAVLVPGLIAGAGTDRVPPSPAAYAPLLPPSNVSVRACTSCGALIATPTPTALALNEAQPESAPAEEETVAEVLPTMEVRPGDTLIYLADWFGVTPRDIAVANYMSVDDYLVIGTELSIPVYSWEFSMPPEVVLAVADVAADSDIGVPAGVTDLAPPEPTPPPVTRAPYIPPSQSDVVAAICSLPWPCDQMVRIAACESGLNPGAYNPAGYYGLFQINHSFPGWDDALTNATVAYTEKYLPALAHGDGLTPWPVCRYY